MGYGPVRISHSPTIFAMPSVSFVLPAWRWGFLFFSSGNMGLFAFFLYEYDVPFKGDALLI